jgi:DNA-directed RNA polymerase specialized sigma24 family protein
MTPEQVALATEAVIWATTRFRSKARRYGVSLEDLAQSALEEVVKATPNWQGSGEYQGFAYRVAIRKIADDVNSFSGVVHQSPRNHIPYLEIQYAEPSEQMDDAPLHETWCSTVPAEEEVRCLRLAVIEAELVRAFGPRAHEAFNLLAAGGYEAHARELGLSRQTVYERAQRLVRVLEHSKALRALWEDL